ncbi:hypothetical protein Aglo01_28500 [Actinokineospora globicatena]|nr:hypothetical protein Aglo01_28500 [Actinokineospora globicatena]GLW84967.1 hypothetical protein Aglo02_26070 [Actinokineospora globicatena]
MWALVVSEVGGCAMAEQAIVDRVVELPRPRSEGIGGRAPGWPVGSPVEDEEYEPTIVRGRD